MNEFKPTVSDLKILKTIYDLNQMDYFPNSFGVYKILKGIKDEETNNFVFLPTFSNLVSCVSKKITFKISMLIRYKYLTYKYDSETDNMFLTLTVFGENYLNEYFKTHHVIFKQHNKTFLKSIAHIPKNK